VLSVIDNSAWVQGADITSAIPVDMINDSVKSVLDEGLKKLAAKGIHATGHFAIGDPLDQIPYFAKELNVDLIVVGHHRAGRLARWWGGRTDGLLLDRVSCSVLVTMGPETELAAESAVESASESRGAASPGETTSPVEHS